MYFKIIMAFLLLLIVIITSVQNTMPLELEFFVWKIEMSLSLLVFYSSIVGAAIVAVLTLPKMASNYLMIRRLNKESAKLKKSVSDFQNREVEQVTETPKI